MKAEELRIGNIVDYYGNEVTINWINDTDVGFSDYATIDYPLLDEIKPIPITEEWLVRFGFQKNGVNWYFLSTKDRFTDISYAYNTKTNIIKFDEFELTGINYIHDLQNLYFALTGEELNYEKATQN